ncbi:helix-turn-helix domain-containing protein [Viridibacillus sp. NPDC093762]|uniref:helix-turn-helix domain-containing protein n=1 Tax=Viridibacillus sp. NPDC093762 TaxID=3390720 RepID=UPI003D0528DC
MSRIAENIKSRRVDKNLTQQELADSLNVSRSTVSNWETNRNYPDLDTLIKISDLLDIPLDTLLKEEKKMVKEITKEVKKSAKRKWVLRIIVPLFVLSLVISTYSIIQNVYSVNKIFFPMEIGYAKEVSKPEEWNSIFFEEKDYLIFKNIFWNKEITNSINNEGDIIMRVKDSKGNVVKEDLKILQGNSIILKDLKKKEKYYFEIKGSPGEYVVTFS